jgi:hypothetical protein
MYYFIPLKLFFGIQFIMVLLGRHTVGAPIYIITDTLFKVSLATFISLFFLFNKTISMEFEDRLIISFAGTLLFYSVDYTGIIELINEHSVGNSILKSNPF